MGGEAAVLYLAWRHGNENPYCLYNGLGPDFRPWGKPDAEPVPPPAPARIRAFIYACAMVAGDQDAGRQHRPARG